MSCSNNNDSKTSRQDNEKGIGKEEINNSLDFLLKQIQAAAQDKSEQEDQAVRQGEKDQYPDLCKPVLDAQYCLEALNIVNPYILLLSGVVENFRLFDAHKKEIEFNTSRWDYNKD